MDDERRAKVEATGARVTTVGEFLGMEILTPEDHACAIAGLAALAEQIDAYEAIHFPVDTPSEDEAEAFRRDQEIDELRGLVEWWGEHCDSVHPDGYAIHLHNGMYSVSEPLDDGDTWKDMTPNMTTCLDAIRAAKEHSDE